MRTEDMLTISNVNDEAKFGDYRTVVNLLEDAHKFADSKDIERRSVINYLKQYIRHHGFVMDVDRGEIRVFTGEHENGFRLRICNIKGEREILNSRNGE